jgi:hypothetical protein
MLVCLQSFAQAGAGPIAAISVLFSGFLGVFCASCLQPQIVVARAGYAVAALCARSDTEEHSCVASGELRRVQDFGV